jgi:hypothetical protein
VLWVNKQDIGFRGWDLDFSSWFVVRRSLFSAVFRPRSSVIVVNRPTDQQFKISVVI